MATKKTATKVTEVKEAKAEAPKAEAPKAEVPKAEAPKAEAPKTEAKKEKKAPAKKAAATKKAASKKAEVKKETVIAVQYQGNEVAVASVEEKVKAAFVAEGHKASSIKTLNIYVKPEEFSAYYVINEKYAGRVDLF